VHYRKFIRLLFSIREAVLKNSNPHRTAVIMLFITAILWSTSGFLIKLVDWHPVAIAGARSLIALIPITIFNGKPKKPNGVIEFAAAVSYCVTLLLFVSANKLTTAANTILLQYSAPVFIIILSAVMLKEKVRVRDCVTVCVVLFGLVLFFIDQVDASGMLGNAMALASGFTMALMMILLRMQKNAEPINSVFWGNLLTFVVGLPFIFTNGMPNTTSWLGLVFLGLFQLGLAYVLFTKAIKHVTTVEMALVPIIEPILNPAIVAVMTAEVPGTLPVIGGFIVVAGVTVNLAIKSKPKAQ